MADDIRFCAYPDAIVRKTPEGPAVQHLIWGDWLQLKRDENGALRTDRDWFAVNARGEDGWLHKDQIQKDRLLEIVFVDIGQGDGCIVSTPENKHIVIDAGKDDNMYRFLRWRFGKFRSPFTFDSFVISHPDEDHYGGFRELLDEDNIRVKTLYHSGLVERVKDVRGPLGQVIKHERKNYITEVINDKENLISLLTDAACGNKKYPNLLKDALEERRVDDFKSLGAKDEFMPGYEAGKNLSIQVLGPVLSDLDDGQKGLKTFGSHGKTKNGHSIILKLQYKDVSVLLGGDLNIPAEEHLLHHYTHREVPAKTADEEYELVIAARQIFQVDFAKACHHGSADFLDVFLKAVNARATIISSGDNERHSHPRADTLGSIGKNSRGTRPLIFSTELARSTKNVVKQPEVFREKLRKASQALVKAELTNNARKIESAKKKHEKLLKDIERSVAIYGAINLRTDGNHVICAQKIEAPSKSRKWDIYRFERDSKTGSLHFVSRH